MPLFLNQIPDLSKINLVTAKFGLILQKFYHLSFVQCSDF